MKSGVYLLVVDESRSCPVSFSQGKTSSNFESAKTPRRRLSFEDIKLCPLVVERVKPIKITRSRLTNESDMGPSIVPEA
jgi:hypothetical protein